MPLDKPTISKVLVSISLLSMLTLLNQATQAAEKSSYAIGEGLPKQTKRASVTPLKGYQRLDWDALMPADWDPSTPFKGLDLSTLQDSDPRAIEALKAMNDVWKNAPVNPKLNKKRIEISGFIVPLDVDAQHVKEFLLVPYFGACIHIPPPPGNQIIHVLSETELNSDQFKILNDVVSIQLPMTVKGTLETVADETSMGFASYRMTADVIERYHSARQQ